MQKYQLYIDGAWTDPLTGEWIDTANPYTGNAWARIPRAGAADVEAAVEAAHRAFRQGEWPRLTATRRGLMLRKFAEILTSEAERLARIEVRDNGKLHAEVLNQCRYLAQWFHYYGGLADKIEGSVPPIDKPNVLNLTRYEPLGVCACITPWNSPLLLLAWKAAPALAAGNTIVVKPSEFTSASTLEFAALSTQAGFPKGVINVVTGFGPEAGDFAGAPREGKKDRVYRRRSRRRGSQQQCRAGFQESDPGTGRQVGQHRVRRRQPGPGCKRRH